MASGMVLLAFFFSMETDMKKDLIEHINAAFSGIWIQSHQVDEAEAEIRHAAKDHGWELAIWDIANGIRSSTGAKGVAAGDPLAGVKHLEGMAGQTCVLVVHNLHRFLGNAELVQVIQNALVNGKADRRFLVVLSPVVQIPPELEKLFVVLEHALPDHQQLITIAEGLFGDDQPSKGSLNRIAEAALGLTHFEAESAMALSITRHGEIRPEVIIAHKAQALKNGSLLALHRGTESFADLGGLGAVKDFCVKALKGSKVKPKGILLLGVPGTGKSALAKALGNEVGRPTLQMDIGALMGSLVGQSEANLRQALKVAEAMGKVILHVDEIEKALSGVGGQGDSGVSTRMFGTLLTWLSDHQSDVFLVATANDISKLPPELTRAERFDAIFMIDTPSEQEKAAIWCICMAEFGLPTQALPNADAWTGAEIRSCCRLSTMLGIPLAEAATNVVPVAVTNREAVERLRTWATGRCLSASSPGIYGMTPVTTQPRRSRQVKPSVN
jgi:hypothetical protein